MSSAEEDSSKESRIPAYQRPKSCLLAQDWQILMLTIFSWQQFLAATSILLTVPYR